LLKKRGSYN